MRLRGVRFAFRDLVSSWIAGLVRDGISGVIDCLATRVIV